jgi:hypothetical protein
MLLTRLISFVILILLIRVYLLFEVRRRLRRLFMCLVDNFEQTGVRYWVDFGTLLGVWRTGDVILGDNDADVCVYPDEENLKKVEKVVYDMGGEYLEWGAYRVYDGYLFVDIYVIKFDGDTIITPTGEVIDASFIEPPERKMVKVGTRDVVIHVPSHVNKVLQIRYGDDWYIPRRKWYFLYIDYKKDMSMLIK